MTTKGVIVIIFGRWCCVNHEPSTVDESLSFRRSANERTTIRGANQNQNKFLNDLLILAMLVGCLPHSELHAS